MSDPPAGALPSLDEARAWVGCELDDAGGNRVGRVEGLYADAEAGAPVWLVIGLESGRRIALSRRSGKKVAVPVRECAAMPGRVWVAQPGETIRRAPAIDPTRPLLHEHEATICAHYGIGERSGRHAEVSGRAEGSPTAQPA